MPEWTERRPTSDRRRSPRLILVVLLAGIIGGWSGPAAAQDATPATPIAPAEPCATLVMGSTTPGPLLTGEAAPPALDDVPFDLLAIDTLATHDEAMTALLTVAASGSQEPDLRQFVTSRLTDYGAETTTLRDLRAARFPDAPVIPIEYQTALLDQALAAAGVPAGSGEAPVIDPSHAAGYLCTAGEFVPFDLAVIDLLSAQLQDGVAIGLLATQRSAEPALAARGQTIVDRETTMIGQLAVWGDAWFGPGAPLVVAPTEGDHDHGGA